MSNLDAMRCAAYARYSSDNQREASITDQLRKCREFAESKGWALSIEHVYTDEAVSGAGSDRPGLNRLLDVAFQQGKGAFDIVLVDDTSRLSRNLVDAMQITQRLKFEGIRLIAVSQGIDSDDEQADVMFTVHGLVDSLYIKELAKKTHRGLEGLALEGFHTGGNCFGYRNVKAGDRVRLEIDEEQAKIVVRIFTMAADGLSLKQIAKRLNKEGVRPPRTPRNKNLIASWCPSAIREMLRRELYIGRLIWNQRKYVKKPGTNKRVSRPRPKKEWVIREMPELRIVAQDLWEAVQAHIGRMREAFGAGHTGAYRRSASVPYLLSGFLKCGVCSANLTIVAGRGTRDGRVKYYGCPGYFSRGTCTNNLKIPQNFVEERFVAELQNKVLSAATIDYALEQLSDLIEHANSAQSVALAALRKRERELQHQLKKLADAVAASGGSKSLLSAIREREKEITNVQREISSMQSSATTTNREQIREYLLAEVADLRRVLTLNVERARAELVKHIEEVRMVPCGTRNHRYYEAQSTVRFGANLGVLAGTSEGNDKSVEVQGKEGDHAVLVQRDPGYFQNIAGGGFEPPTFGL